MIGLIALYALANALSLVRPSASMVQAYHWAWTENTSPSSISVEYEISYDRG
jgi:hypothetical protein